MQELTDASKNQTETDFFSGWLPLCSRAGPLWGGGGGYLLPVLKNCPLPSPPHCFKIISTLEHLAGMDNGVCQTLVPIATLATSHSGHSCHSCHWSLWPLVTIATLATGHCRHSCHWSLAPFSPLVTLATLATSHSQYHSGH